MTLDLFAADNARPWLARLDPRVKLALVLTMSVAVVSFDSAYVLAGLCGVAAILASGLRLGARGWGAVAGIVGLVVWSTVVAQGFFYPYEPRTVLLSIVPPSGSGESAFAGVALTLEGMTYGVVQSLRFAATALVGLAVSLSTSPERMLAALAWYRLPATLGFMTTAALRFLPLLIEEVSAVREARRLRGYRFRAWGPPGARFASYGAELSLLRPVLAAALRRAETLGESVTARGFDPRAPRTYYPPLTTRSWERFILAAAAAASATMIVLNVLPKGR